MWSTANESIFTQVFFINKQQYIYILTVNKEVLLQYCLKAVVQ